MFAIIFYASSALAATPQEIINNALSEYNTDKGLNITGDMLVEVKENITDKAYQDGPEHAVFDIQFNQRSLSLNAEGEQNNEGYLRLKKFLIEDNTHEFAITEPLTVFWRVVYPYMYIKLDKLPEPMTQSLKENNFDLEIFTQKWLRMEASEQNTPAEILSMLHSDDMDPTKKIMDMFKELGDKKFLQVLRTEKKYKNEAGDDMIRVRIGINRGVLYQEYQKELREAYKISKYSDRMTAIKTARDEYNQNLKDASELHMAGNLNLTTNRLERIEFGLIQTKNKESCDWNDDWSKKTCKKIGTSTVRLQTGIWFNTPNHTPIEIPYNALNMEDSVLSLLNLNP